ncbi:MAG: agmatinase [Flavobacteriales bacterium]|nr:agmatinase [Flavobacteriales bacterium]
MEFLHGSQSFLGITDPDLTNYENARIVVQSLPYENTSSYIEGSALGPQAILDASSFVEFYDEELRTEICQLGIATQKSLDFGDLVDEAAVELIRKNTLKHLKNGKFVVSLGAEHTVTLGTFLAYREYFPSVSVLQIDAHSDLRESYQGNPYSHACVMARINEYNPLICQVGIRALCKEEAQVIDQSNTIYTVFGHELSKPGLVDDILNNLGDIVYITVDADGFDPSVMPAVGTIEPGGLQWFDALRIFREVCSKKKVVGFDIVECAPRPGEVLTEYSLAQLAYKIMTYSLSDASI